jgi:hypothetical protein
VAIAVPGHAAITGADGTGEETYEIATSRLWVTSGPALDSRLWVTSGPKSDSRLWVTHFPLNIPFGAAVESPEPEFN